jgi:hypothetical protein
MDEEQISKILHQNQKTNNVFRGCFPCNLIPNPSTMKHPSALIVNLDPHIFRGSHWVAIFTNGMERQVIYFDSYALPINLLINNFLSKFPKIIRNKRSYQAYNAETCAQYCILFIYFLSLGYSFDYFLELLDNCGQSDLFVRNMINKIIE